NITNLMDNNLIRPAQATVADGLPRTEHDISAYSPEPQNNSTVVRNTHPDGTILARHTNTEGHGPSTLSIIEEAELRGIPWRRPTINLKPSCSSVRRAFRCRKVWFAARLRNCAGQWKTSVFRLC